MDHERQEKVGKFEEFVDQRLKPDLVRAIAERDKVFEKQKTFSDLRRNIENLEKNSVTSLRTMVNLGSEVYAQADVPDTRHIFVDVGLGFHVEFTWSEALTFIAAREEKLSRWGQGRPSSMINAWRFPTAEGSRVRRGRLVNTVVEESVHNVLQIEEYTNLIASIKSHIKMVYEGIREIMELEV